MISTRRFRFIAGLNLLMLLSSPAALAQRWDATASVDSTVTVGRGVTLWSSTLQEGRKLLVRLPADYQRSTQRYPVVYLLDAETQFVHTAGLLQFLGAFNERIPDMILIGVVNEDRNRDFTPPTADPKWQDGKYGGADQFLKYLSDELAPWVDANFRTVPYRILVGHSFGGLFNAHAMVHRPDAFQAHIAISPSLWWDQDAMVERTATGIRRLQSPPWLFVSWADDEPNISRTAQQLVQILEADVPPALRMEHRYYPGDDHMSTPHRALYDGLEQLFKGWRMPKQAGEHRPTLADVEAHYASLSRRYGFKVSPTAAALEAVAQELLDKGESSAALALLRRNASEYPHLAATHRSLGAALEKLGRKSEAASAYQQALRMQLASEQAGSDALNEYREKIKALTGGG